MNGSGNLLRQIRGVVVSRTVGGHKGDLFQKNLDISGICPLRSPYNLVVTSV
jgi:hypothetical protein